MNPLYLFTPFFVHAMVIAKPAHPGKVRMSRSVSLRFKRLGTQNNDWLAITTATHKFIAPKVAGSYSDEESSGSLA